MGSAKSKVMPQWCEVQFWDYPFQGGRHQTHKLERIPSTMLLSDLRVWGWDDDIQSFELRGPSDCWIMLCEHPNLRGRCMYLKKPVAGTMPWGHTFSNIISSIKFGKGNAPYRRLEGDAEADVGGELLQAFIEMKPSTADALCTALYEEMFATEGHLVTNSTIKEYEKKKLGDRCTEVHGEGEAADFCKFNVAAMTEIFDDAELDKLLRIEPEDENEHTELDHCTFVQELIFESVEAGEMEGISIENTEEGDFYMLDASAEGVTAGALIAAYIGKTMIKIVSSAMR